MIYVGVDPAFRPGGFKVAFVDMKSKTVRFLNMRDVFEWYELLKSDLSRRADCFICIEDSNRQNLTFDMRGTRPELARRSRNVGCNQAVSHLAVVAAHRHMPRGKVFAVSPREKGKKIRNEKTFEAFVDLHGLKIEKRGPITQDERDAFKLAMMCARLALLNVNA
jgi:hypothetical protein